MPPSKLNRFVVIGAFLYGLANIVPLLMALAGLAIAFGAQYNSPNSSIGILCFGGILLWFLLPIAAGDLVSLVGGRHAHQAGQSVDRRTAASWGALATGLGQIPLVFCVLWIFANSLSSTRDLALSGSNLLGLGIPVVAALLGAFGGSLVTRR
jgi:hypothetical protein